MKYYEWKQHIVSQLMMHYFDFHQGDSTYQALYTITLI